MKLNYEQLKRLIGFDVKTDGEWCYVLGKTPEGNMWVYYYHAQCTDILPCHNKTEIEEIRPKQPPEFKVGDKVRHVYNGNLTFVIESESFDSYWVRDVKTGDSYEYMRKSLIPHFDEPVREITKEEAEELLKEKGIDNIKIR